MKLFPANYDSRSSKNVRLANKFHSECISAAQSPATDPSEGGDQSEPRRVSARLTQTHKAN